MLFALLFKIALVASEAQTENRHLRASSAAAPSSSSKLEHAGARRKGLFGGAACEPCEACDEITHGPTAAPVVASNTLTITKTDVEPSPSSRRALSVRGVSEDHVLKQRPARRLTSKPEAGTQIHCGTCKDSWTVPGLGSCGDTQNGCPATPCDLDTDNSWCVSDDNDDEWFYCSFNSDELPEPYLQITWELDEDPRPDAWVGFFKKPITETCAASTAGWLPAPFNMCPSDGDWEDWYYLCDGFGNVEVEDITYLECPGPAPKSGSDASIIYTWGYPLDVDCSGPPGPRTEEYVVILFGDYGYTKPLASASYLAFDPCPP
mmetsp:Transcript_575/g.1673  ORF Transcript_575/g.1673 Transcript_575/m.1673 type:complete len:320 (-) Transcript_575:105-1064(-)|eukprot:CAMPEP_0119261180 /NCGR_PEP_ID=MMETSP1329-20130426/1324_1 /TAXON_ID=114041 /ORGANISM="Genus nov. species nov., Strain RCC1024" /LENGTH=319 /DNA_ID=CAMNT_0007260691 /DNA_START=119 /DNA_END=1078 /DNA_ORIENTATION=+